MENEYTVPVFVVASWLDGQRMDQTVHYRAGVVDVSGRYRGCVYLELRGYAGNWKSVAEDILIRLIASNMTPCF